MIGCEINEIQGFFNIARVKGNYFPQRSTGSIGCYNKKNDKYIVRARQRK